MKEVCEQNAMRKKRIAPEVMECLMNVQWEGNVRELRNLVERLLVVSKGHTVTFDDLPLEYKNTCKTGQTYDGIPMNYEQAKTQFELNYLKGLLAYTEEISSRLLPSPASIYRLFIEKKASFSHDGFASVPMICTGAIYPID